MPNPRLRSRLNIRQISAGRKSRPQYCGGRIAASNLRMWYAALVLTQGSVKPVWNEPNRRDCMRSRMFRRGLTAIALLGLVVLAGLVVLPLVASTQIVRDHLALELSRWS